MTISATVRLLAGKNVYERVHLFEMAVF